MFTNINNNIYKNICTLDMIHVKKQHNMLSMVMISVVPTRMCYDMKGRGRSITVKLVKVHYSTRQYRRKRMARTPSVRCTTPMIETRQPSVLNGSIQTTSVTPS